MSAVQSHFVRNRNKLPPRVCFAIRCGRASHRKSDCVCNSNLLAYCFCSMRFPLLCAGASAREKGGECLSFRPNEVPSLLSLSLFAESSTHSERRRRGVPSCSTFHHQSLAGIYFPLFFFFSIPRRRRRCSYYGFFASLMLLPLLLSSPPLMLLLTTRHKKGFSVQHALLWPALPSTLYPCSTQHTPLCCCFLCRCRAPREKENNCGSLTLCFPTLGSFRSIENASGGKLFSLRPLFA